MSYREDEKSKTPMIIGWSFFGFIFLCLFTVACMYGCPAYSRNQAVKDANNAILISQKNANNQTILNEIKIAQTQQLVQVEQQKAQIRVEEAKGIAASQQIINATLTDRYLQHEAIQAQLQMAGSPNHTQIYIPVGTNGIPLVKTIE